jgi:hypothetical protein
LSPEGNAVVSTMWFARFPVDQLVRTFPFADISEGLDDSATGDTIKPIGAF